jgi:Mrp family chromosome partitioning ATPase/capsular polysaccharide biosynthesis protein
MNEASETRYSSLRDYLAVLRRQKLVVLAVTIVFGGAALALSASQEPNYEAVASTQFNDIARDATITGLADLPADTNPLVNAAIKSEEVTSLATAKQVKRELKTKISPERLQSAISTRVGSQTIFVEITAKWDDPAFAAKLANAFATVAVREENQRLERQVDSTLEGIRARANDEVTNDEGEIDFGALSAQQQVIVLSSLSEGLNEGTIVPAEVARRAEVPENPSSPKTARNTILGLIVGLALGLLAAFARDVLDRRIRNSSQAHDAYGLPVVGRVGQGSLGTTGATVGANGRVVTAADIESFRILRTNLVSLHPETPPRSVLVTSAVAQEGKSTVAAALAGASAAAGQRTLLVEGDLRRPAFAKRLGINRSPGLAEYLAGTVKPQDILQTVKVNPSGGTNGSQADSERTLVCIAAGNPMGEPAELLALDRCREFFAKVTRAYDLVVVDSSPLLATADPMQLASYVDSVLVCARLTTSTTEHARGVREAMALLQEPPAGLVVTGAAAGDGYYYGNYGD